MARGEYRPWGRSARGVYSVLMGADPAPGGKTVTGPGGTGWGANTFAEVEQIDADASALDHDLDAAIPAATRLALAENYLHGKALPSGILANPRSSWYQSVYLPWFRGWRDFRDHVRNAGGFVPADASDITGWINRAKIILSPLGARDLYFDAEKQREGLVDRRREAKLLGIKLTSPDPDAPNAPAEASLPSVGNIGKYALIGAGVIGGVVLLAVVMKGSR